MTPGSVVLLGIVLGVALAVAGMIWNAIHLVRLGRASVPAMRLSLIGLATMPVAGGVASLLLAPRAVPLCFRRIVSRNWSGGDRDRLQGARTPLMLDRPISRRPGELGRIHSSRTP